MAATYLWGGIARLDILSAPSETALAFYGPPCLHVEPLPLLDEDDLVELDHHAEDDGMTDIWAMLWWLWGMRCYKHSHKTMAPVLMIL